jgi:hypothetical protein
MYYTGMYVWRDFNGFHVIRVSLQISLEIETLCAKIVFWHYVVSDQILKNVLLCHHSI